jgi:hypothetical protein
LTWRRKKPKRAMSQESDPDAKVFEQHTLNVDYEIDSKKAFNKSVKGLKEGMYRAHHLIFRNYCTKAMQRRVEE